MRKISDFLGKFKNIGLKESSIKDSVVKAVNEMFGKEMVSKDMVIVKDKDVFIKTSGALKSEIILLKNEIIVRAKSKSPFPIDIENIK